MDEDEPELFPNQPDPDERMQEPRDEEPQGAVSKNVTALGSRLRVLEEQYTTLRNKSQLVEDNLLEFEQNIREELNDLNDDVMDLKNRLRELQENLQVISEELDNTVKEHDFKVLERYIDLWDPRRFVTKEELHEKLEEE